MNDFQNLLKKLLAKNKPLVEGVKLLVLPFILFLIFLAVFSLNRQLEKKIAAEDISSFVANAKSAPYPSLNAVYTPVLSAQAAIVMDDRSKVVLYVKNPGIRFSMASTTKIMTALTALDYYSPSDILTVYDDHIEGSTIGLRKGEQYTLESLLYAMFLPSANDAAVAVADNFPGGRSAFVTAMNEKAKQLHLTDTRYDDPAGLEDDGNYTTVVNLAHLASEAIKNPEIAKIMSTKQYAIADIRNTRTFSLANLNELLGVDGVFGVKTGYTEGAGGVLVTAKKEKGHTLIIVVMKSIDRFADTRSLLNLVLGNISYVSPLGVKVGRQ